MFKYSLLLPFLFLIFFSSCTGNEVVTEPEFLNDPAVQIGETVLDLSDPASNTSISLTAPVTVSFDAEIDITTVPASFRLRHINGEEIPLTFSFLESNTTVSAAHEELISSQTYILEVTDGLKGAAHQNFRGLTAQFTTGIGTINITSLKIAEEEHLSTTSHIIDVPRTLNIEITFSHPLNPETITSSNTRVIRGSVNIPLTYAFSEGNKKLTITSTQPLMHLSRHQLNLSNSIKGAHGETVTATSRYFYTETDPTPKFPVISDDELLTRVQQQTFNYFWDFAHPASGMARERNTSGNLVTSGGSGFGIMAIIVGIERGFITRAEGVERLDKILDFLETADRFHGVWSHWINGNTGAVIPFSANDNGGDLVETSFLVQGLITFRQYLNASNPTEQELITRINTLWETVEWDWYRRNDQDVLYWHWSPDKEWTMNLQIRGWNECLITYLLAAASPTHSIPKSVYDQGWARNGNMQNGNSYEGIQLPLGSSYGGPLFFSHYSFLGIDPRNLSDAYADYWQQNVSHSLINHNYVIRNPKNFVGYSDACWGLTASDNHSGYSAHSPTNDLGVITPTAALSSFPYTPEESMKALKFFYYTLGDKLWAENGYGFYDAFNITQGWTANSYLAIDQGPIVIMIENYRTGLLWDLFMSAPEVQDGLNKLGFSY
ncbi:MAG: Ig-like domain-containing protein [Cyclobacteriaceae bacterium]|nr:Ig-like domain-containing protein [Cyclobacteriaceae bacterium]